MSTAIDPTHIVECLHLFCVGITEIRALKCQGNYGGPFTVSGYFDRDHFEKAANDLVEIDSRLKPKAIYFIFNEIHSGCHARAYNRFVERPEQTTTDSEIISRRWIMVDIDPVRPSGVSSTDDEKEQAIEVREAVFDELKNIAEPIVCDSGNGWHLYIPVELPANDESLAIVKRMLEKLKADHPLVDVTVSNAARITKLYGTIGRKGDSTPDRPHRQSRIIYVPDYLSEGWSVK